MRLCVGCPPPFQMCFLLISVFQSPDLLVCFSTDCSDKKEEEEEKRELFREKLEMCVNKQKDILAQGKFFCLSAVMTCVCFF